MNNMEWQKIWLNQGKIFMDTANAHLKNMFTDPLSTNADTYVTQMQTWISDMNQKWDELSQLAAGDAQAKLWQAMADIAKQANATMLAEWQKRMNDGEPVKSIQELYSLWLTLCNDIYLKNMQDSRYQAMYGEMLSNTMQYWMNAFNQAQKI